MNTDIIAESISSEQQLHQIASTFLETSTLNGKIYVTYYAYDKTTNRTYINVCAVATWNEAPVFHFKDTISIVALGSTALFSLYNSSSSATYINQSTGKVTYVYDVFEEKYESFNTLSYIIPISRYFGSDTMNSILYSVSIIYHGMSSGLIDLAEVTAIYEHQLIATELEFSIIAAYTPGPVTTNNISIVPTATLNPIIDRKQTWKEVVRVELKQNESISEETIEDSSSIKNSNQ